MAAYAALISLKNTIEHILNSSRISLVPPSPQIIDHAHKEVQALLQILRSSSRKNALDAEIRDAVCKFEDLLQSHLLDQISSQFKISHPLEISIDLQDLEQDVESFAETVKKMHEAYAKELDSPLQEEEEEEDEDGVSSRNVSKLAEFSAALNQIRWEFIKGWPLHVMALNGIAGIGKTTVAREVCNDPLIKRHFEHIVWVKIGQKYQLNKIARDIVAQVNPKMEKRPMDGDEDVTGQYLRESLKDKRCLIVLDDAWDTRVSEYLCNSLIAAIGGSYRILLTTRLQEVAESMDFVITLDLLSKEESWDLLRERVFGEDHCPYHLEGPGKKIAQKCDGLPLTIVKVADLLSTNKSPEHWRMVAERPSPFYPEVENKISKVLRPSYDSLPHHLKLYFLYMGVFPENFEIPPTKLINLWAAEGFLEPKKTQTLQTCAIECLEKLSSKNVIVFVKKSSDPYMSFGDRLKTCRLQSSFWQFCNREAMSNKFFHALDNHGLVGVKGQRLCIQNNILCTIKDEYKLVQNSCALSARSLLCYGPHHRYQAPLGFGLMRLLKVLDALTVRFYEFPAEVVKLVQLKYLALTCNGDLPPSISNLWVLEFLVICRYSSIKSFGAPTYVPMEIWDMQELKHIQIMGSSLPSPSHGACLRNLLTLVGVSAHSCTRGVFKRIPNLEKLGIRIELVPDDDHSKPFCRLNQIFRLRKLHSLKCVVVNPELGFEVVAPPAPLSMFPSSLRKLHLSGMGYPWEYMKIIGSIPYLHVLKLRNYAFQGPMWEIEEDAFDGLRFLIIEDTDLVRWKVGHGSLGYLVHLSIKHCYNLEEIDWESEFVTDKVEIVDSNPLAVECLNQIKSRKHYRFKDLAVHSSWDEGKNKV